ncbi:MAG: hypothetical protein IJR66_01385 [Clostridia bacterium]|nr:hypothetical protein [Clostridia bacterium]
MVLADGIAIGVALFAVISGLLLGFGKQLYFISGGIVGFIISSVVAYFLYGAVLNIPFVSELLSKIISKLAEQNNAVCDFLIKMRIELVVYCVALFMIIQVIRIIVFMIIKDTFEIDNVVIRVINKVFGVILSLCLTFALMLIVFQIIYWVKGTDAGLYGYLQGSLFKLDYVYLNNPLLKFVDQIRLPQYILDLINKK